MTVHTREGTRVSGGDPGGHEREHPVGRTGPLHGYRAAPVRDAPALVRAAGTRGNEAIEHERERAEGVRVAYVAATRARDLLVVPVVGDEERDGWYHR